MAADSEASSPAPGHDALNHDIIVVGASAGGVEALAELAAGLPAGLPAAVFIVLHIPPYGSSVLPAILSRRGLLPASHPADGDPIEKGHIYVAPPDHHLLVGSGQIQLTRGPAENGHRPAVDTLFRSAARSYGPRTVGVVLTGTLDDGTAGLQAIKMCGGLALVQDPGEALFPSMPQSAIEHVAVDAVQTLAGLAETLVHLAHTPITVRGEDVRTNTEAHDEELSDEELSLEVKVAELEMPGIEAPRSGKPSAFSCPDCHGVLWEVQDGELVRYRCRVGHAFSPESLLAAQSDTLEEALWVALRALEESAALAERLRERAAKRGHALTAQRFGEQAQDAHSRAETIREALTSGQVIAHSASPPPSKDNRLENNRSL